MTDPSADVGPLGPGTSGASVLGMGYAAVALAVLGPCSWLALAGAVPLAVITVAAARSAPGSADAARGRSLGMGALALSGVQIVLLAVWLATVAAGLLP